LIIKTPKIYKSQNFKTKPRIYSSLIYFRIYVSMAAATIRSLFFVSDRYRCFWVRGSDFSTIAASGWNALAASGSRRPREFKG